MVKNPRVASGVEPRMHHIYLNVDPERSSEYPEGYPCGIVRLYDYGREDVKASNPICICNSTGLVANWCPIEKKLKIRPDQAVLRANWDDQAQVFVIGLETTPELESSTVEERYRLINATLTFMAFRQNAGTQDFLRYNAPPLFPSVNIPIKYLTGGLMPSNPRTTVRIVTRKYISDLEKAKIDITRLRPSMERPPPPTGQPLPTRPRPSTAAFSSSPAMARLANLPSIASPMRHSLSTSITPRTSIATTQSLLPQQRLMQPTRQPAQIPQTRTTPTTSTRARPADYVDLTTEE